MLLILSLVGGLAIALTFQLLFANLGVALGLTLLDFSPAGDLSASGSEQAESSTDKTLSLPFTHFLGAGVLLSATTTISIAALLSTEFSSLLELRRGIIFGLIVWATYWLLFIWLSTTTLTNVVDSVLGTVIAGGRKLLSLTKRASYSKPSQNAAIDSEASKLKAISDELSSELSQIAAAQEALPALLTDQREDLIEEVCNRTQLSRHQADIVLNGVASQTNQTSRGSTPRSATEPDHSPANASSGLLASIKSTAASKVRSAVESQIDLQKWQEISKNVIQNVDISDLESLRPSNLLESSASEELAKESEHSSEEILKTVNARKLDAIKLVASKPAESRSAESKPAESRSAESKPAKGKSIATKLARDESINNQPAEKQPSATTKALQKKLIAYCRYTNPTALTPESLAEKIAAQQAEKKIEDLSQTQINSGAIASVIAKRKALPEAKKQALIHALNLAIAPSNPAHPERAHTTPAHSPPSTEPELSPYPDALEKIKRQIAQYLHHQDKTALQPKQVVHDLTRILGSGLQSIPHPSQLPARSHIEALWDKSHWQRVLEKRKDMTIEEVQQMLGWVETEWEPIAHQANNWIQAMQAEASQLLDVPEDLVDEARQQIVEQLGIVKENVETQMAALKDELQIQADATRQQAAIAAWWLFSAILLSSLAAASAGWVAVRY